LGAPGLMHIGRDLILRGALIVLGAFVRVWSVGVRCSCNSRLTPTYTLHDYRLCALRFTIYSVIRLELPPKPPILDAAPTLSLGEHYVAPTHRCSIHQNVRQFK